MFGILWNCPSSYGRSTCRELINGRSEAKMIKDSKYVKLKYRNDQIVTKLVVAGLVVVAMIIFGILMLLSQGGILPVSSPVFYQFLTIHGTGMIGAAALAAVSIMWYFLSHYVDLSMNILKTNFI